MPNPWDSHQKFLTTARLMLDKLEGKSYLGELVKSDPKCPYIAELNDSIAATRQAIQEMETSYALIGRYIQKNATAFAILRNTLTFLNHVQAITPDDRNTQSEVGRNVLFYDIERQGT